MVRRNTKIERGFLIILISIIFVLIITLIIAAQRPSIPSQSPIGGGWTDDGTVIRLTTSTDNVGIGINTPSTKLDITGKIKISDGTQGTGKVLTSDSTGLASWQVQPVSGNVSGNGTPNFIPLWTTSSSLGDSIMKIDADGNLLVKPSGGKIIFIFDTRCIEFSNAGIRPSVPCPP